MDLNIENQSLKDYSKTFWDLTSSFLVSIQRRRIYRQELKAKKLVNIIDDLGDRGCVKKILLSSSQSQMNTK